LHADKFGPAARYLELEHPRAADADLLVFRPLAVVTHELVNHELPVPGRIIEALDRGSDERSILAIADCRQVDPAAIELQVADRGPCLALRRLRQHLDGQIRQQAAPARPELVQRDGDVGCDRHAADSGLRPTCDRQHGR
jgi:hypothetical protein